MSRVDCSLCWQNCMSIQFWKLLAGILSYRTIAGLIMLWTVSSSTGFVYHGLNSVVLCDIDDAAGCQLVMCALMGCGMYDVVL